MIRPAGAQDLDGIVEVEKIAFGVAAWTAAQIVPDLAVGRILVAMSEEAVVGFATIAVAGETADLIRIAVVDSARRTGVGSRLLAAGHARATVAGADRILLEVAEANVAAQEFYRSHGYAEVSRRRRYYPDGDDALVFCAPLR